MQNTVSIIAEGHGPARPITVCAVMKYEHIVDFMNLFSGGIIIIMLLLLLHCVCVHLYLDMYLPRVDKEGCCCSPVTNRRLKHAVVCEKCPGTGSHSTHTPAHTHIHTPLMIRGDAY